MTEALSPNPKQRLLPGATRIQSPTSPFFLGSNDDKLERAQARAARAAKVRRSIVALPPRGASDPDNCLGKHQILDLFRNCIKLASENKINQKNTWELNLIDHLTEVIKVDEEDDTETNFQKASCTLEAGVKIYSVRVDSVHSEAYKVLGGMNRAGQENEQDVPMSSSSNGTSFPCKREMEGETVGSKPIECMCNLPIKKVYCYQMYVMDYGTVEDANVDSGQEGVDPLYHQTSAQFDEGGAKGLLMNNLGVYGGCRVLFDSLEIPGKCMSCENQNDKSDTIDLSFAREYVEQMVLNMRTKDEISPTLRDIVNQFDEDNRRPSDFYSSGQKSAENIDVAYEVDFDGDAFENCGTWNDDHDDEANVVDEGPIYADSTNQSYQEENEPFSFEHDMDDRFEKVDGYLFLSLGFTKQNAWAGPDHWKYQKAKGLEDDPAAKNAAPVVTKRPRNRKQAEVDIDFTKALDEDTPDVFAPPKNPKSLLLSGNRAPCNIKLPEDCHYQPEDLVKLFLLPNVKCLGGKGRKPRSDESRQQCDDYGPLPSWDDESVFGGQYDDGNVHSDVEDSSTLVSQPRQNFL
uniref:Condensin complex subunit 2 n=1 Tax=Fagus sylvatica TaxID=28930 RepID=A0A2N9FSU0_FAGSY